MGGFALHFYGSVRLTGDVDIICNSPLTLLHCDVRWRREPQDDELELIKNLQFGCQQTVAPNGVPINIIVRNDDFKSLYEDALEHAIDWYESPLPLVHQNYIAAMKMVAHRRRDDDDLDFLVRQRVIDIEFTSQIMKKHLGPYAVREFEAFVKESLWRAYSEEE